MRSIIFAESFLFILPKRVKSGTEGGQINHQHLTGRRDLQAQEGSTELIDHPPNQQQGGCLSQGPGDGVGGLLAPGPQQPGASLLFLRASTCAVSHGQPLRASGFGPSSQDLFPGAAASTINMQALSGAPCWASQI